jgi:YhcH/YjgK/YiaL family protein
MILDKVANWKLYFKGDIFFEIFEELKNINVKTSDGIYKFKGYEIRVMTYDTKLNSDVFESHKDFVDIQILISGEERIKVYDLNSVIIKTPYNKKNDTVLYTPLQDFHSNILIKENWMCVFFSDDIHNPQLSNKIPQKIKKAVIKVDKTFFIN